MSRDNPLWGAPRIHGELLKLGIAVGETSVRKYMVRHHPPRVPGPRHRVRRTELVPSPARFRGLLSSEPDAPGIGEGLSSSSPDPIGGHGARDYDPGRRRTASSLRAPRRIKASSARFHPHCSVLLRGAMDGHRHRAREPVGIAERVLSADDMGRVTSKAALSKTPKAVNPGRSGVKMRFPRTTNENPYRLRELAARRAQICTFKSELLFHAAPVASYSRA